MKELQYILNKYLLNKGKQKKYLAFVLALSMLVSFAVPLSLIQPADSMTIQTSPLAEQVAMASGGWFSAVQATKPDGSYDFSSNITNTTVTAKDGNQVTDNGDGTVTIQGGSAAGVNVNLKLQYTVSSTSVSKSNPYIYYQLPEGVTVPDVYYGEEMQVIDSTYEDGGYLAGYYSISNDGLIVIRFTDDYIDYLATTGSYTGTIDFDGYISAAETASGDRTVTIGNTTITAVFEDANYNIYKDATSVVNNGDGTATVTWQIKVTCYSNNNSYWSPLANLTVTDARFPSGGSGVTINPDGYGSWSGASYTFNMWAPRGQSEATFTFSETVNVNDYYSTDTKKLSNTASYNQSSWGSSTNNSGEDSAEASFLDTTVTKSGTPDYMTGSMNKQVNWSIVVDNPYGANLSNYVISDQMLTSAASGTLAVMDASGNAVPYTISGGVITLGSTDASKVIVTYKTPAEIGSTYNNTVEVTYPNSSNTLPKSPATVTYENPYTLEKTGYSFDPENKKVYWDVTVKTKSDNVTLNGLVVTDDAIADLTMNDVEVVSVRSGSNSSITATNTETSITLGDYGTLTKDGSTIIIADGTAGGLNEIKLRYATTITDAQISGQETVSNTVSDSSGNEKTAYKQLTTTYSLNKTGSYDASTQKVTWTITVKNSASNTATLNGMVLTDTAFENLFGKNFTLVHAYQPSYTNIGGSVTDNIVTFGNGSTMTLSGTILTFANVNGEGVNEVKFTYQTDVSDDDIKNAVNQTNEVTANKPVTDTNAGKVSVQVNNPYQLDKSGTFDASTGEVTWTVTVKNTASGGPLGGVVLTDEAFANVDATKINITTANYNYNTAPYTVSGNTITFTNGGTATFDGNTLTFSDDAKIGELVFQYTTAVSSDDFSALKSQTNSIADNYGHSKDVTVPVTNPYSLSKTGQFNPATGTITWTVTVSGVQSENSMSTLGGMVLKDNAFKELVNGINLTSATHYYNYYWTANDFTFVKNSDTSYSVTKDGNIVATVTLNTTDGTVSIANATDSNASIKGLHVLTFTYETKVDEADIIAQTPQSNGIGDNKGHYTSVTVTPSNPFELTKDGAYDAENDSVIWTIHSKNAGAGTLNGVILTDKAFSKLTSISQITVISAGLDGNYNFTVAADATDTSKINISIGGIVYGSLSLADDTITITDAEGYGLDDVKIQFSTVLTDEEKEAGSASNSVNDNKGRSDDADVPLTNPYTLGKGGSYDAESGLITWNINAGITSSISTASLNGIVLTDEAIKRLTSVDEISLTTARYNNTSLQIISTDTVNNVIALGNGSKAYATMKFDFAAGTVTFTDATTDGTTGLTYLDFTYQTAPTAAERVAGSASNTVKNEKTEQTDDATVPVTTRSTLGKYFENSESSETIYGNDDVTARELSWRLDLLEDGGYADKGFLVDGLSSVSGSHYITQTQAAAIKITAGQKSSDNYSTTLTVGTDYTITFYDASSNAITEWTADTKAVRFEIDFADSVDKANLRYVRVAYKTTADISNVLVSEGSADSVSASYGNTVTFGSNTDTEDGFDFTRYPSDYVEKVSIKVSKNWSDSSGSGQEGVQVQLYQKLNDGTSDWTASGAPVTLTNDGGWTYTWENLPKTETTRTTEYLYKVEEAAVEGYTATYSTSDGINSGEIRITNTLVPYFSKVALTSSNAERSDGAEISKTDLIKTTIDGVEYYLIGWKIVPNSDKISAVDTLPTGFTLCQDSTYCPKIMYSWGSYENLTNSPWGNSYQYDSTTNTIQFYTISNSQYVTYYTKIPVADLDGDLPDADSTLDIQNTITPDDGDANTVKVTITNSTVEEETTENATGTTDDNSKPLLTKDGKATLVPGRLQYTILVNPEGKNLANGDTIDISDLFNLESYTGLNDAQVAALNANLYSIKVQEVTVVDDLTYTVGRTLSSSEYQYTVDYKLSEVVTTNYNFSYLPDANNYKRWVTSDCVAGDEVTLVLKSTNAYLNNPIYNGVWSNINLTSSSYDSTNQEWTYKFMVPSDVTEIIVNIQDENAVFTATTSRTVTTTAALNMSVPDESALLITYQYDVSGVEFNSNDVLGADNTASFDTGNASASDSADADEFVIKTTSATVTANKDPVIQKTSTNDYSLTLNDATFKLAYYDSTSGGWVFATGATSATSDSTTSYTPVWAADASDNISTDNSIASNAYAFTIGTISMKLEEGKLYKIIETDVPEAYEGSNLLEDFNKLLTKYKDGTLAETYQTLYGAYMVKFVEAYPDTTAATFEQLLQLHLKGVTGGPYDNFFNNFHSIFYFTYGSSEYTAPTNFSETVITVPLSGTLSLTNSILMDVSAAKSWDSTLSATEQANATVTLKLYWSYTKKSTGYPSSLNEVTAEELGLVSEFTNEQTIAAGQTANWGELPAGINGKPIYYYVKETAYTIGGVTYTLDETTGHYVAADGTVGAYKPIYTGNAASGGDATISVTNTKGLTIEKVWKNSDNTLMDPDQIPLTSVPVKLYGKTSAGTETLIGTFTIAPDANNDWLLTVDDEAYDLTPYTSFRVEEALETGQLYGYAISYTYNTSGTTGSIVITNKDNTPTEVDVVVTKEWADGASGHDSITVNLWQTTVYQEDNGVSLTTDNAVLYQNVQLSESNSWTKTWEDLPYKSDTNQRYYYYPVEVVPEGYAASYDRTEKSSKQSVTINNYVPGSLNLEKTWQNSSGTAISGSSALLPESIEIEIYRRLNVTSTDSSNVELPTNLKVYAFGDSITTGYNSGKIYSDELEKLLLANGYTGASVSNSSTSGYLISQIKGYVTSYLTTSYDMVTVMAGTNDLLNSNDSMDTMKASMTALIDEVFAKGGDDTVLFVCAVPRITALDWYKRTDYWCYMGSDAATLATYQAKSDKLVTDYNTMLSQLAATYTTNGKKVIFVDTKTPIGDQLMDGCHPNADGQQAIADTLYAAINSYYGVGETVAPPTDIDSVPEDLTSDELYDTVTITPDESGNWKLSLDLPDKDADENEYIYYAKEKTTGTNYNPTYQNNGQTLGDTSETIKISNTVDVAKTEIYVEKTWFDGKTTHPDITLTLKRSADGGTTWETVTGASIVWDTTVTPWRGTYSNLELCDSDGNYFIYKVEETVPTGYSVTYDNPDGVQLSADATAEDRTLALINTAIFSLNVQKIWADGTDTHNGDTVTIKIHRDIVDKTTGSGLMLALSTDSLKVQTGSDGIVTANSDTITAESNNTSVATVSVSGNTITIHGVAEGAATITVKNGSETATVVVTVSDAPVLLLEGETAAMTAGDTQQLTVKMSDDSTIPGTVTYSSSNTAAATVDASTGLVTALNEGEVTITATNGDGLTATYDIQVSLSDSFTLSASPSTIYIDGTSQVTPSPIYGTFTYESLSEGVATVNTAGVVKGVSAGQAVIRATRNDGETADVTITVQEIPLTVSPTTVTVTENTTTTLEANKDLTADMVAVSNANVEIVSVEGKVITIKGVTAGSAVITVNDGVTAEQTVNVTVEAASQVGGPLTITGEQNIVLDSTREIERIDFVVENENSWACMVVSVYSGSTTLVDKEQFYWWTGGTINEEGESYDSFSIPVNAVADKMTINLASSSNNLVIKSYTVVYKSQGGASTTTTTTTPTTTTTTSTTTTSSSSSNSGDSGESGESGGSTSGETKTGTVANNETLYMNDAKTDAEVESITFEIASIESYKQIWFKVSSTANEWFGDFYVKNYGSYEITNPQSGNFTVTLSGSTVTLSDFSGSISQIMLDNGGTASFNYTITYATPEGQSLSLRTTTSTLASSAKLARAASDEGIEVEFVDNVATVTLMASDNWEKIIKNLPVCDAAGNVYYYWIEETAIKDNTSLSGYTPTYKFEDGDAITADQDFCINAAAPGDNPTATVKNTRVEASGGTSMPSTGGTGTQWYYIIGMMTMLMGTAGFIGLKLRQRSRS